ncbi:MULTISPECIES: lactonase family protein [unclassified Streptomyces]|uniref:lactonase family protein n=1 Tax=unclassified Streptomyces TaxID=2593676 RepID=UPI000BF44B2A|nr:lactonase family protein [Streptomyces sp. Ru87]PGH51864.1 hypothetical protein CRI70_04465 [Streptomyces sp. Ru87]
MGGGRAARAYIGSFTSAGGHGITTASVGADGSLGALHSTRAVTDPSFLALSADGGTLYAVSETEDGAAVALDLGADRDRPAPMGRAVPVGGDSPTHLALAADHLVTANYGSGSVSVLPVREDGGLGAPTAVHRHRGSGPNTGRQEGPHAHAVLPDPSGRWVLAVDLGTDSVYVHALDPRTGSLNPHRETELRPGSGPRHLVFHPAGDRAYVINELEPTVTACRWDAETGELTPAGESPVVPAGAEGERFPSEIVISRDGRFLWAANRGHDSIAVLALDGPAGTPRLVTTVGCGGHWPRHLALGPDGGTLYAANERSGDVTWFTVDPATGVPRRSGSLEAPAASCVVFGRPEPA